MTRGVAAGSKGDFFDFQSGRRPLTDTGRNNQGQKVKGRRARASVLTYIVTDRHPLTKATVIYATMCATPQAQRSRLVPL